MTKYKCDKCGKEFNTKKEAEKHENNCKIKVNNRKNVSEIKCKCNSCNHIWHYLPSEEKRVKSGQCWSAYGMCTCCLPLQLYSKHESLKWEKELDKFKKCPKCGSVNIAKKEVKHEIN